MTHVDGSTTLLREALEETREYIKSFGPYNMEQNRRQKDAMLSKIDAALQSLPTAPPPSPDRLSTDELAELIEPVISSVTTAFRRDGAALPLHWKGTRVFAIEAARAIIDRLSRQPEAGNECACGKFDDGKVCPAPDGTPLCVNTGQPEASEPVAFIDELTLTDFRDKGSAEYPRHGVVANHPIGPKNVHLYTSPLDREKMLAALKPFADAAEKAAWPTFERDSCVIDASFHVTVGDLRRAREAADAIIQETR